MLQDLAERHRRRGGWFADPANWSGNDGIPNRMMEHLVICLLSMVAALLRGPAHRPVHRAHRPLLVPRRARSPTSAGRCRRTRSWRCCSRCPSPSAVAGAAATWRTSRRSRRWSCWPSRPSSPTPTRACSGVDGDLREAARGMGMRGSQVLRRVELPLALPVVLAGVRIAAVQVVATATLGAVFGGGGLGRYIIQGFARQRRHAAVGGRHAGRHCSPSPRSSCSRGAIRRARAGEPRRDASCRPTSERPLLTGVTRGCAHAGRSSPNCNVRGRR